MITMATRGREKICHFWGSAATTDAVPWEKISSLDHAQLHCIYYSMSFHKVGPESVPHLASGHWGNRPSWYIDGLGSDLSPSLSAGGVLVIHASQIFSLWVGFK